MPGVPSRLSRRRLIVGGLAAATLAACGGSSSDSEGAATGEDDTAGDGASDSSSEDSLFLQPGFADGLRARPFLVPGVEQVVPVFLSDGTGRPLRIDEVPPALTFEIRDADGGVLSTQELAPRAEGIPVPHFSAAVDLADPGVYLGTSTVDGNPLGFEFRVGEPSENDLVAIGDPLRPVDTPTTSDARGVDPVCTLLPDPCPFHDLTLTDALGLGTPVVYLVATPAFCQTTICGPVVDLLVDRLAGQDDIAVVHAEVWKNADVVLTPDGLTDAVLAYDLDYEPSQLNAGADGVVRSRLDFAWDADELDEALAALA